MSGASGMLDDALYGPRFTVAPSRILRDRFAVYDPDGNVARKRTRLAVFATREDAEHFAEVANRRRKVDRDCRHGAQREAEDTRTSDGMKQRQS